MVYINKLYYKVAKPASKIVTNSCNMGTITTAQARRKKVLLLPSQYSLVQIVRRVICADMSGATVQVPPDVRCWILDVVCCMLYDVNGNL